MSARCKVCGIVKCATSAWGCRPGPADVLPGAIVRCEYRGTHAGVVLADDDPRAWAGTGAFPTATPDPAAVRAHVVKHRALGSFRGEVRRPVLWCFGRVYWDSKLVPAPPAVSPGCRRCDEEASCRPAPGDASRWEEV